MWGLAAAGLICTAAIELPVGGTEWNVDIVRGPADGPHPRAFRVIAHEDFAYGRAGRPDAGPSSGDRPTAGVWWERTSGGAAGGPAWRTATLAVSLWYFAAVGLAGNAATLWTLRRTRTNEPR